MCPALLRTFTIINPFDQGCVSGYMLVTMHIVVHAHSAKFRSIKAEKNPPCVRQRHKDSRKPSHNKTPNVQQPIKNGQQHHHRYACSRASCCCLGHSIRKSSAALYRLPRQMFRSDGCCANLRLSLARWAPCRCRPGYPQWPHSSVQNQVV